MVDADQQRLTMGLIYLGFTLPIIPVYVVLIVVMLTDKELCKNKLYRLSNQITFVDFGQLLIHIIVSFFIMFPHWERSHQILARTAACTLNSLFLAMYPIISALSISRILVVKEVMSPDRFPLILNVFIAIGWLYTICVWICGCVTQNITLSGIGMAYDLTKPGAATFSQLEWYLCLPSLAVTWSAHFVIVLHMQMNNSQKNASIDLTPSRLLSKYKGSLNYYEQMLILHCAR
ncbi:hypothetical protein ANCCAN_02674 [Ancylostoma caninum]|uniref:G-protein coupled receptors family 1 profile domain-containing protein n=1 Tax=Ancylostoma caninum TaxID=29170 RepID=A0A368H644_ANCCA|nr:hypothetical protein ANCCAN_02674 [Ancylostoma caninum]